MNGNNVKRVISAPVPCRNDLCCVMGQINFDEVRESSAKSNYHWQIMKCRLIVYTMPEVIASPVFGSEGEMYIITTREFFKTGKMQSKLKNMYIKFSNPKQVTFEVYEACLRYTILFKVAPRWLKVGEYLLQGETCITSTEVIRAIRMNICITDQEAYFELHPAVVKMSPLRLTDFYISDTDNAVFMKDPKGYIDMKYYGSPWVHVLPSMKKGLLVAASREIPKTCPFSNYQELRRHWKNMYGYRLPKSDEDIIYFQIYFRMLKSTPYTYPDVCVRSGPLDFLRHGDHETTVDAFVQDLNKTVPEIFSRQLQLSENRGQFVAKLYKLDEDITRANILIAPDHCALSSASALGNIQDSTCNMPISQQNGNTSLSALRKSNLSLGNTSTLMSPTPSMSCGLTSTSSTVGGKLPQFERICDFKQLNSKEELNMNARHVKQENKHFIPSSIDSGLASQSIAKTIPSQKSRVDSNQSASTKTMSFKEQRKTMFYIPCFTNDTKDIHGSDEKLTLDNSTHRKNDETKVEVSSIFFKKNESDSQTAERKLDQKFHASDFASPNVMINKEQRYFGGRIQTQDMFFRPQQSSVLSTDASEFASPNVMINKEQRYFGGRIQTQDMFFRPQQSSVLSTANAPEEVEEKCEIKKHFPIFKPMFSVKKNLIVSTIQPTDSKNQQDMQSRIRSTARKDGKNLTEYFKEKKLAEDTTSNRKPRIPGIPSTQGESSKKKLVQSVLPTKRSGVMEACIEQKKKKKPANVLNMDIERMANDNNLDDVNVATLRSWLKEHSVPCKNKDKKIDLIAKVITFLAEEGNLGKH